ncbi:glycosyltransferase family 2 protein [Pontibacter sp. H249]|uniref:glycosyltransferase family 2 protein n=1 Tax=Pontibacter sp. H249 TaxID=3133420 RepID=UPI0030C4A41E
MGKMFSCDIAASIVAYKNDAAIINKAISSFLNTSLSVSILIVDNSPTDVLKSKLLKDERIHYIFNNANVGFSKAHNQGIKYYRNKAKYFLVLNPDVYFDELTLSLLFNYLEAHNNVGLIAPKVLYPNGDTQVSRRLIPNPVDLVARRLPGGKLIFKKRASINEYHEVDNRFILEVPFLLGCFMLLRMSAIEKVGLFDERYFVYLEDLDLCRRMSKQFKIVYHGQATIYHHYQRASSRNPKMFLLHTVSMIKYFTKWGWFNDIERKEINKNAITKYTVEAEEKHLLLKEEPVSTYSMPAPVST